MQKLNLGEGFNDPTAPTSQPETNSAYTPLITVPPTDTSTTSQPGGMNQKGSLMARKKNPLTPMLLVIALAAGVFTGYGAYKLQAKTGGVGGVTQEPLSQVAGDNVSAGDVFGVQDEKTYKDSADGYLEIGGIDGEGSHKLLRAGGVSQTVYLTSSVTDLSKFDGMEVKVWGETFKGQNAGWLMDVGRVQVVNPQGQNPSEE